MPTQGDQPKLDAAISAALDQEGINTYIVKIDSDTPLALTAFILRCLRFVSRSLFDYQTGEACWAQYRE